MRRRKRRRRRKFVERKCKQSTPWPDRWIHDVSFHGRPTLYFITWNHCFSSLSSSLVTALLAASTLSSLDLTVDLLRHNFRCCCCWRLAVEVASDSTSIDVNSHAPMLLLLSQPDEANLVRLDSFISISDSIGKSYSSTRSSPGIDYNTR